VLVFDGKIKYLELVNLMKLYKFIIVFITLLQFCTHAKWITGVGVFEPGRYRVDNEISPLPFGWNVVPMIGYISPRLRVIGPTASLRVFGGGPYEARVNVNMTGDRYRAHEVAERDSGVDVGASVRLLFLTLKYGADVAGVYHGNSFSWGLSRRIVIDDKFIFIPSYTQRYVNSGYANYYYGVKESEVGYFQAYRPGESKITSIRLSSTWRLNETHSIALNINRREFADEIYNSPTVREKSYYSGSLFWNYTL
jgi:hypothetical protein